MQREKQDYSISIARIVSCVMILLCHWVQNPGFEKVEWTAQFFNSAVFAFFMLSGCLYGNKSIQLKKIGHWYMNRAKKILIPFYIVVLFLFAIYLISGTVFSPQVYIVYFLNMQGFFENVAGLGHLWFITAIMICYLITPLLQLIRDNEKKKTKSLLAITYVALQILFAYFNVGKVALYLHYVGNYIFAYFILTKMLKSVSRKRVCVISALMCMSVGVRFLGKALYNGQAVYEYIIVLYTQSIIAFGIIFVISYICKCYKNKMKDDRVILYVSTLEKYTMEVYMVHMLFMRGPVSTVNFGGLVVGNIVTLAMIIIATIVLKKIEGYVCNIKK